MIFLDEAIKYRKSERNFISKEVAEDVIAAVIRAGTEAPSAKNRQPWYFIRLNKDVVNKIAALMCNWAIAHKDQSGSVKGSAQILLTAPVVIAVCSPAKKEWPHSDYISIGACLENMSLKAVDAGLGSLIVCDVWCVEKKARRIVGTNKEITALFLLGYGRDGDSHRCRNDIVDMVQGVDFGSERAEVIDDLPEATVGDVKFVFISYSHHDKEIVLNDIREFKKHGIALWYDKSILYGDKWDEKALGMIGHENCTAVFVYVSKSSVVSEAVCKELKQAKECNVPVFPIHIGGEPLGAYIEDTKSEACLSVLNDKCKFIDRSSVPAVTDDVEAVAEICKNLGVVASSGVYDDFNYEVVSDGVKIICYNGTSETVNVPARISGKPVVEIGDNAICEKKAIKKIILPYSVRRIGAGAFSKNTFLEEAVLPDTLDEVGAAVFRECASIKKVNIPSGIKRLPEAFFRGCVSLSDSVIPYGVEELGEAVYNGCTSLERVFIPDSVKRMTEGGFYGCAKLKELRIPEHICGLEIRSFETCPLLTVEAGGFRYVNSKGEVIKKIR